MLNGTRQLLLSIASGSGIGVSGLIARVVDKNSSEGKDKKPTGYSSIWLYFLYSTDPEGSLHQRVNEHTYFIRRNIALIIIENIRRAGIPLFIKKLPTLLEAAYSAHITGSLVAASQIRSMIQFNLIYIAFLLVVYFIESDSIDAANNQAVVNLLRENRAKFQEKYAPNAKKDKKYNDARNNNDNSKSYSDPMYLFGMLSRSFISFFIQVYFYWHLLGPGLLVVVLLATYLTRFVSPAAPLEKRKNAINNAIDIESATDIQHTKEALQASRDIENHQAECLRAKILSKSRLDLYDNLVWPATFLGATLMIFYLPQLLATPDPLWVMTKVALIANATRSFRKYPQLEAGDLRALYLLMNIENVYYEHISPGYTEKLSNKTCQKYLATPPLIALRIFIYVCIITTVTGLIFIPITWPSLTSSLSTLANTAFLNPKFTLGYPIIAWTTISIAFRLYSPDCEVKNVDSRYAMLVLLALTVFSAGFFSYHLAPLLATTQVTEFFSIGMALGCFAVLLFDALMFQHFFLGLDLLCTYVAQECTRTLQYPTYVLDKGYESTLYGLRSFADKSSDFSIFLLNKIGSNRTANHPPGVGLIDMG